MVVLVVQGLLVLLLLFSPSLLAADIDLDAKHPDELSN